MKCPCSFTTFKFKWSIWYY